MLEISGYLFVGVLRHPKGFLLLMSEDHNIFKILFCVF